MKKASKKADTQAKAVEEPKAEVKAAEIVKPAEAKAEKEPKAAGQQEVSPTVDKCMRLYAYLPELYISEDGFVWVKNTPKAMVGNAKLYTNKYYKK